MEGRAEIDREVQLLCIELENMQEHVEGVLSSRIAIETIVRCIVHTLKMKGD